MSLSFTRPNRWRRALAVASVMALPLSVAACADDESDDPDIINEQPPGDETPEEPMPEDEGLPTDEPGTEDGTEDGTEPGPDEEDDMSDEGDDQN